MSEVACFDASALDRVLALPDEHPERRHARACPRCGALLESYRLYREPGADADAPHVATADARLDAWLQAELAPRAAPAPAPRTVVPAPRSRGFAFLRPALAFAAAVAVVGVVVLWPREERAPQLRGPAGAAAPALTSVRLDDGGLHLRWSAHPAADAYVAIVLAGDGREVARLRLGAGTAATVPPGALPFPVGGADQVFLRVAAMRGDEVLATSAARPLLGP